VYPLDAEAGAILSPFRKKNPQEQELLNEKNIEWSNK
jgi:hypothetical protein